MIFAIYLLICGIVLPFILGYLLYKNIKKGVKPSEKVFSDSEHQS